MAKNIKRKNGTVNPYRRQRKQDNRPLLIGLGIVVAIALIILTIIAILNLNKKDENTSSTSQSQTSSNSSQSQAYVPDLSGSKTIDNVDSSLLQFSPMKDGEEIAIMTVKGYGDIKIRFFKDQAPKAVENFLTHSKNGYYNGLTFHRVINDFMVQGGDPTASGSGGESIWGKSFEDEFSDKLFNFRGALSMANAGANTNGSQFFIVQATQPVQSQSKDAKVIETYNKIGGTPHLDGKHTVFGQVFEGINIVDAIAKAPVGAEDKPVEDVIIEKITVTNYKK
jgi:cyclophilin family peptidyl-prolyl cis-trans isomerase